jgi:hypothetical protein
VFIFHISLFCSKGCLRPDYSILTFKYHRKTLFLNQAFSLGNKPRRFRVCSWVFPEKNFGSILLSCLLTELQLPYSPGLESRTDIFLQLPFSCNIFETRNLGLEPLFHRDYFPSYQKPPSPALKLLILSEF